jgi:hypothetical protein
MIAELRSAHRWIWLLLALLLPLLVVMALRARTTLPIEDLPPALAPAAEPADDAR